MGTWGLLVGNASNNDDSNTIWRLHCRGPWGPEYMSYWCWNNLPSQPPHIIASIIALHHSAPASNNSAQLCSNYQHYLLYNINPAYYNGWQVCVAPSRTDDVDKQFPCWWLGACPFPSDCCQIRVICFKTVWCFSEFLFYTCA